MLGEQAAAAAQPSHAAPSIGAQQQNEHVQSGQSGEGSQQASQQPAAPQANTASQPQQTEQRAGLLTTAADQQQAGTINLEYPDGSNAGEMAAAILSALSNQERDSTDHLASGSASTASVSSIVVRMSSPLHYAFSLFYVSRELHSACCHPTLLKNCCGQSIRIGHLHVAACLMQIM